MRYLGINSPLYFMKRLIALSFAFLLCHVWSMQAQHILTSDWQRLVPSENLPEQVKVQRANNNLDACQYKGRYYVAFRTAPSHFASKKAQLYIISSANFSEWKYETTFHVKADLREPRFVVYQEKLFFYFFELGTNSLKFEPHFVYASMFDGNQWTEKQALTLDGFVPWRFRVHQNKVFMSAYYGVDLYNKNHHADLRLFTSEDGLHYTPYTTRTQIDTHGAEEGEFIFDSKGDLWATIRIEGSGSYLCHADKDSLGIWHKKFSKRKYDSALLIELGNEIYLISRHHLKGDATKSEFPKRGERRNNMLRYSLTRKVTAIFKLNRETIELEHIMDFPSTGDNAFPAAIRRNENSYYLLNYSSDITKRPKNWIRGQLGKTYIYWCILNKVD